MTTFTTRIQLHNADTNDFNRLIAEMKKESFIANKVARSTAEFTYRSAHVIKDVIATVMKAAVKTGKKFSFTVIKQR